MIAGRVSLMTNPGGSVFVRMHIWEVTLNMIKSSPVLGTGLGTFHIEFPKFKYPDFDLEVPIENLLNAHNEYLEILAEMGVLGLGVFLWFIFGIFSYAFKYLKNEGRESLIVTGLISGIAAMLVMSLFSVSVRLTGPAFIFWLLIGLTMTFVSHEPESKKVLKKAKKERFLPLLLFSLALTAISLIAVWHIRMYQANMYLSRGQILLKKDKKAKALLELSKALDKNPFCVTAQYLLGCINLELENLDQAKNWFERLEKKAPHFTNVHEWRGKLYFKLNDLSRAEEEYELSTRYRGTISNHFMLGQIYMLRGKWDLAIEELERVGQKGFYLIESQALHQKDVSVDKSPAGEEKEKVVNSFIYCAEAYYQREEFDKALQKIEIIQKISLTQLQRNTLVQLYVKIAWKYAQAEKNLDRAVQLCRKALDLNSPHPEIIHDTLAWVYFKKGMYRQAKEQIQKALELDPQNERYKKQLSVMEDAIRGKVQKVKMGNFEK